MKDRNKLSSKMVDALNRLAIVGPGRIDGRTAPALFSRGLVIHNMGGIYQINQRGFDALCESNPNA